MNRNISSEWRNRLKKGQTFDTFSELKAFIVDFGVQTERIILTYKKDSKRLIAICKMSNVKYHDDPLNTCPMRIRAILKKKSGEITITQIDMEHSCEASQHFDRRMHTNADTLATQIFDIVMRNRQTRPSSIRDTAQALIHPDIHYHTAWAAKKRALERLDGNEKDSFHLIPGHCQHILDRDPGASARWSAPNGRFESLFVCPSAAKKAVEHCRPLVAFDGTHRRSAYPQILLIATTIDANNTVLMLAYCMVPTENETEWRRFLRLMKEAIPNLDKPHMVFISDREKGLLSGVDDIFPRVFHCYCTWHLGDNCRTTFGKQAHKDFEPLVYATSPEQYKRRFDRIKAKNAALTDYIGRTADPQHYSRAYCPVRRWGYETSQQAESLNRAIKPQRQEVAFKQSNLLWDYMMAKYFEKATIAAEITTPFPPHIMTAFRLTEEKAILLVADASSGTECRVTDSLGRQFLVQFEPDRKCSCGDWQDVGLPCSHAWRACTRLSKRHFDFVSDFYSTAAYKRTYSSSIPAILHADIEPNSHCREPAFKRGRGRPTEKRRARFQPEDPVRRRGRCSHYKGVDHTKRKCPTWAALLAQGRGQGPTEDSDSDGADKENEEVIGLESDSDMDTSTDTDEEPDPEFTVDEVLGRKDQYMSDDETTTNSLPHTVGQVVLDLPVSSLPGSQCPTLAGSLPVPMGPHGGTPGGFFTALLTGVLQDK